MNSSSAPRFNVLARSCSFALLMATAVPGFALPEEFADSLWLAESSGSIRVDSATKETVVRIPSSQPTQAVAVDVRAGIAWVFSDGSLKAYDFLGAPLQTTVIDPPSSVALNVDASVIKQTLRQEVCETDGTLGTVPSHELWEIAQLAVSPAEGTVWLGLGHKLYRLSAQGAILSSYDLKSLITSITVDASRSTAWVATCQDLRSYDVNGTMGVFATIGDATNWTQSISFDPLLDEIWAAQTQRLNRFDRSGGVQVTVGMESAALVQSSGGGQAWVAADTALHLVDAAGSVLLTRNPFTTLLVSEPITALTTNPHDQSAWVASLRAVTRVAKDGTVDASVLLTSLQAEATSQVHAIAFYADVIAPDLTIISPTQNAYLNNARPPISAQYFDIGLGASIGSLTLKVNGGGKPITCTGNAFAATCTPNTALSEGAANLSMIIADFTGNVSAPATVSVVIDTIPPPVPVGSLINVSQSLNGTLTVAGAAGSVVAGDYIEAINTRTGQIVAVYAAEDGSFVLGIAGLNTDSITILATDRAGNTSTSVTRAAGQIPAAPVATTLPISELISFFDANAFIVHGTGAVQFGLAPNAIDPPRATVFKGRVINRAGATISGVTVTLKGYSQFGYSTSRSDGSYDLMANAGIHTVEFRKDGYLPVHRQVTTMASDFAVMPDVVLTALDTAATTVTFGSSTVQVARGSTVTDSDGTRRATLLFMGSTTAQMVLEDGSRISMSTGTIRATEYTVGTNGPAAMPAPLPATSAYTYAVELNADQAITAGATSIEFNKPVYFYLENFIDLPVGSTVPVGFYDRARAQWVATNNGRTIKILSISGGMVDVDVDGSGTAANSAALTALGFTNAERQKLATLYSAGQTLWRVPLNHFTPFDCNLPSEQPQPPNIPPPTRGTEEEQCKNLQGGSIIECQTQTLGESVPIVGSELTLNYRSDRVPGRAAAFALRIPLSGASIPPTLKRIEVEVFVAGRRFFASYAPTANLVHTFVWDGKDIFGRTLNGEQPATVDVGYVYDIVYVNAAPNVLAFARTGTNPLTLNSARTEFTSHTRSSHRLGLMDASLAGLGRWTLSEHMLLDLNGQTLYSGTGERRDAVSTIQLIETVAGNGEYGSSGDGGSALSASLSAKGVALGADGSVYVAAGARVRRITADGIISTVAGGGSNANSNGIPATQASFDSVGVATGADGSFYIAEQYRVRRVGSDGLIHTVAGTGVSGYSGDGGPATAATLSAISGIAVGRDGSLYIADKTNEVIRQVFPDGTIETIAGLSGGTGGDGSPATTVQLYGVRGVTVAPDGAILFVQTLAGSGKPPRIRRIGTDGILSTVAGGVSSGCPTFGDTAVNGKLATEVCIGQPKAVAAAPDGSIFYTTNYHWYPRVKRIDPEGYIRNYAGKSSAVSTFSGEGGPAGSARFGYDLTVAVAPDGKVYFAEGYTNRVYTVSSALRSRVALAVASSDGSRVYEFSDTGRHLRTKNALTGAVLYTFDYDANGWLTTITDSDNRVTRINRDGSGVAQSIVAPYGQVTTLTATGGYLTLIQNPAAEKYTLEYFTGGLLKTFTNPRNYSSTFTYDSLGRLATDTDAAQGGWTITRTETNDGYTVGMTSAESRLTSYEVLDQTDGSRKSTVTSPAGLATATVVASDGTITTTLPDGTVSAVALEADPRFNLQAPVIASRTISVPSGKTLTIATTRSATLATPGAWNSLTSLTETVSVNGKTAQSAFDVPTLTLTRTTPMGRTSTATFDAVGRPLTSQVAGLAAVSYGYDAEGRLHTVTSGSGATARTVTLDYRTADGYLGVLTDSENRTLTLDYTSAGRVKTQVLPGARTVSFGYDPTGNLSSLTPPGRPAHSFDYSVVDLENKYTPPTAASTGVNYTQYAYNKDRQLTTATRPDSRLITFNYGSSSGRLDSLTLPTGLPNAGTIGYSYHATKGTLTSISAPSGLGLAYTYDGFLTTGETLSGAVTGTVAYGYDGFLRVNSLSVNGTAISYAYDDDGLLTQAGSAVLARSSTNGLLESVTLGSTTTTYTPNAFGELESETTTNNGSPIYQASFTRDKLGRIKTKSETVSGVTTNYEYTYKPAGQLETVRRNGSLVSAYAYDANGNRTSYNSVTAVIDNQDRLTQYGAVTYTYTENGELKTRTEAGQTRTYGYDPLGSLITTTLGANTIDYLVDGRGRRIGKKLNGTLVQGFLYQDQLEPVAELNASNQVVSRFVYGSKPHVPDYMIKGGVTYRIVTDYLGSVRLVVNVTNGSVVQRMSYDEFGNVTEDTSPGFQPFGFAGGIYDRDTKLVRFGARDYDPQTGRWMAKDPIGFNGGDVNLYAYVGGNPISFVDPSGLWSFSIEGYWGWGGGITFGVNPNGSTFVSGRFGFGFGGGLEFDPTGTSPGYDPCREGAFKLGDYNSLGIFGELGAALGPAFAEISPNAGVRFEPGRTGSYGDFPNAGAGIDFDHSWRLRFGGAIGVEVAIVQANPLVISGGR